MCPVSTVTARVVLYHDVFTALGCSLGLLLYYREPPAKGYRVPDLRHP